MLPTADETDMIVFYDFPPALLSIGDDALNDSQAGAHWMGNATDLIFNLTDTATDSSYDDCDVESPPVHKMVMVGGLGLGISAVGIPANMFLIVVLAQKELRKSYLVYLLFLASLDLTLLICYVMLFPTAVWAEYLQLTLVYYAWSYYVGYLMFLSKAIQVAQSYLIVCVTIERYLEVSRVGQSQTSTAASAKHTAAVSPRQQQQASKMAPKAGIQFNEYTRYMAITTVLFGSTIFRVPALFELYVVVHPECAGSISYMSQGQTDMAKHKDYQKYYTTYANNFLCVILPFVILLSLNVMIILRMKRSLRREKPDATTGVVPVGSGNDLIRPTLVIRGSLPSDAADRQPGQAQPAYVNQGTEYTQANTTGSSGGTNLVSDGSKNGSSSRLGSLSGSVFMQQQKQPSTEKKKKPKQRIEPTGSERASSCSSTQRQIQQATIINHSNSNLLSTKSALLRAVSKLPAVEEERKMSTVVVYTDAQLLLIEREARRRNVRAATSMMIAVVTTYLFCNLLSCAISIWEYIDKPSLEALYNFYSLSVDLISLLVAVNCTLRLPIYYLCNPKIKTHVQKKAAGLRHLLGGGGMAASSACDTGHGDSVQSNKRQCRPTAASIRLTVVRPSFSQDVASGTGTSHSKIAPAEWQENGRPSPMPITQAPPAYTAVPNDPAATGNWPFALGADILRPVNRIECVYLPPCLLTSVSSRYGPSSSPHRSAEVDEDRTADGGNDWRRLPESDADYGRLLDVLLENEDYLLTVVDTSPDETRPNFVISQSAIRPGQGKRSSPPQPDVQKDPLIYGPTATDTAPAAVKDVYSYEKWYV